MSYRRFILYDALGAVLWTIAFVLLGYAFGASWRLVEQWVGRATTLLGVGAALVALVVWLRRRRARAGAA